MQRRNPSEEIEDLFSLFFATPASFWVVRRRAEVEALQ